MCLKPLFIHYLLTMREEVTKVKNRRWRMQILLVRKLWCQKKAWRKMSRNLNLSSALSLHTHTHTHTHTRIYIYIYIYIYICVCVCVCSDNAELRFRFLDIFLQAFFWYFSLRTYTYAFVGGRYGLRRAVLIMQTLCLINKYNTQRYRP